MTIRKFNCWIVFEWQFDHIHHHREMPCIVGVFDDEGLAVAACRTVKHYVVPMQMNETAPEEPVIRSETYYPRAMDANA